MKRLLSVAVFFSAARTFAGGDPVGTAKLISNATFLTEQTSGDTFAQISAQDPVIFTLTGPGKFQVDFRVNMRKRGGAVKPVNLEVFAGDQILTELRINARPSRGALWRNEKDFKPSESAGFFLQLPAGTQNVMFRIDDSSPFGAAVSIVEASQAKKPLPADTVALDVPIIAGSDTQAAAPATPPQATPAPAATPTPLPSPPQTPAQPTPAVSAQAPSPASLPPAGSETPKPRRMAIILAGGVGVQSESAAFDSDGMGAGLVGLSFNLPAHLFLGAEYEFRYGAISVPVVGGGNTQTPEVRHEAQLAFGWAPAAITRGDFSLSIPLALSYQFLDFSNAVAPNIAGLIGLDVALRMTKSWFSADAGIGYGQRIHDSTPDADAAGSVTGRLRWQGELVAQASPLFGGFVAYQGESLILAQTTRVANLVLAGIILSPL